MNKISNRNILAGIGFFLTAVVLCDMVFWLIISFDPTLGFEETKQIYLSVFPSFVNSARLLTLFYIVMNCIAIVCLFKVQEEFGKSEKLIRSVIILNIVMLVWQVFSLM